MALLFLSLVLTAVDAFVVTTKPTRSAGSRTVVMRRASERQTLGLLTFDLDDTLYPIDTVEQAANEAFVTAMTKFGYAGTAPDDIVQAAKDIRAETNLRDPKTAAALTHGQVRELAIRREMERITVQRKLQSCADDWATPVESLSPLVVANAKK